MELIDSVLLLDTNVILYFLGGRAKESFWGERYLVSIISEIELLSYPLLTIEEEHVIRKFLSSVEIIGISDLIKETTIQLRKQYHVKLPDAIIAATAKVHNAVIITNDVKLTKISDIRTRSIIL